MAEENLNTETPKTPVPDLPDVVVEVEPDTNGAAASTEKKSADPVADLASQYKELEETAKKEKAAREDAEARADTAAQAAEDARREAAAARAAAQSSNLDTINTALAQAQSDIDRAKADLRTAKASGDIDAEVDALDRLASAKTLAQRYDEAKADLEARAKEPPKLSREVETTDPVEAYVKNRTPKTAAWLREHKDFILDRSKNSRLTAAHYNAIADKLTPDTPEYFEHVEKFLGLRKDEKADGKTERKDGKQVAPVTPTGGGSGNRGNEVRLSAGEAKAATDGTHVWNYDDPSGQKRFKKGDPIGIQEFARRKLQLQSQGAYDRTYETQ